MEEDVTTTSGLQLFTKLPSPVISMVAIKDRLFVATEGGVYELYEDGRFYKCEFERLPNSADIREAARRLGILDA